MAPPSTKPASTSVDQQAPAVDQSAEQLAICQVSRAYAGLQALDGVSMVVRRGQIVGLLGPNGAGKSTLVNIVSGFDHPDTGTRSLALPSARTWRWPPWA